MKGQITYKKFVMLRNKVVDSVNIINISKQLKRDSEILASECDVLKKERDALIVGLL